MYKKLNNKEWEEIINTAKRSKKQVQQYIV